MNKKQIAIIGAGASGLMCADFLSDFDCQIHVFEQMPSAGRKILWAGKTGLNLSHHEPIDTFISRYDTDVFADLIRQYDCQWIQAFCHQLGIQTYIGSTGRLFPVVMKASPLLRSWLYRLTERGVQFFYRHRCLGVEGDVAHFYHEGETFSRSFDAIVLACGGASYPKLGSTGAWVDWFGADDISTLSASNVGICRQWSPYLREYFGKPLKRVSALCHDQKEQGDIIITHYGVESGVIYKLNRALKEDLVCRGQMTLTLDLLPDVDKQTLIGRLQRDKKRSLSTTWQKAGLDKTKIALLRECTDKADWSDILVMAHHIKNLSVVFDGFRPLDEAISTAGGVRFECLDDFCYRKNPHLFVCGEMLNFDAPTGGYLLTACFATGRGCGASVARRLKLSKH